MFNIQPWIMWLKGAYDTYGYLIVFCGAMGENTACLVLLAIWWFWQQKKQRVRRGRRTLSSASSL